MEIRLLSPVNTAVVEILPPLQNQILSEIPNGDSILENTWDWRSPTATDIENSAPRYINFSFGFFGSLADVYSITLFISQTNDFAEYEEHPIMPGQAFISLTNFKRDTEYFWKIVAFGKDGPICESEIAVFRTSAALPQWYKTSGISNLRDIGGWMTDSGVPVNEGLAFRGSGIGVEGDDTDEALDFFENKIKIKTELDLRFDDEIRPYHKFVKNADYYRFNILPYASIANDEEKEKYCKIFKILANRDAYPVYFHCHAGADRTGTVAALLKFMLGVSDDDVATDYELTSISPYGGRFRTHEMYDSFLKYLLTLGSTYKEAATNYLLSCGITEEEIQTLKDIYLK